MKKFLSRNSQRQLSRWFFRFQSTPVLLLKIVGIVLLCVCLIALLPVFHWQVSCRLLKINSESVCQNISVPFSAPIGSYLWISLEGALGYLVPLDGYRRVTTKMFLDNFYEGKPQKKSPLHVMSLAKVENLGTLRPIDRNKNIPRIIHQLYPTDTLKGISQEWSESYYTVKRLTLDGYNHYLWSDLTMRQFIAENNPEFLQTYDSYPFQIQRVDAFRYFVLYHIGGFYVDFDIGARRSFDPLIFMNGSGALLAETKPFGVTNDFMGFRAKHPLMKQVIEMLPNWHRSYVLPYATVMLTTGSSFLSAQFKIFNMLRGSNKSDVVIITPDVYQGSGGFLWHVEGSTWHSYDAFVITFIGRNLLLLVSVFAFAIIMAIARKFGFFRWLGRRYRVVLFINHNRWQIL